jgi:2-methylisocitrate lyase-like PEP mutase family enzyme
MTEAAQLRALLRGQGLIVAPGAYDGLTARLVEQAGFPAVYMTGAGTAAAAGYPDFGLLSMSEMVDNAARIARSVRVPVIADADTGYGNELNAYRAVQEYERCGIAGIHIEDQLSPKRCGHLDEKQIIAREDWIAKLRAACAARRNPEFVVIARTDARAVVGFEEAVGRANAAIEAGADVTFVEAPQTMEEVAAVPRLVRGPCLLNVVHRGKTPAVDIGEAERMGYRVAIVPVLLLTAAIGACDEALAELKATGRHPLRRTDMTVGEVFRRVGADEWTAIRTRFRDQPGGATEPRRNIV